MQCTFAHSDTEVRDKAHLSQKYKTKLCINFSLKGYCSYGSRCHYLHAARDDHEDGDGGQTTRSNSEDSECSQPSCPEHTGSRWMRLSHNKRIELIQTLGFDYSIRYPSP
jgi:hypothetical protein